jgi:hypothetical protein
LSDHYPGSFQQRGNVYERQFRPAVAHARKKALEAARERALEERHLPIGATFTFLDGVTLHTPAWNPFIW